MILFVDLFFLKYCNIPRNAQEYLRIMLSLSFHTFVEIDDMIENKIMAFNKYRSQVRPGDRDADSIRNQARYRGHEVGKNLCEAFYAHRFIL